MDSDTSWWDRPEEGGDDRPVRRHAPDAHNYHLPDPEMLGKMRGSRVGRFAVVPAANRDGTSKGFDANVAGVVHVDPDAPDHGVIFDPSSVNKKDLAHALAHAHYPHQVYYQLGTPAPLLDRQRQQQAQAEVPRTNSILPGSYIVPAAAGDGSQAPAVIADGMTPAPYSPLYRAQEEQRVNPVPPLYSLPTQRNPVPTPQGYDQSNGAAAQPQPAPLQYQPPAQPQQPQVQAGPAAFYPQLQQAAPAGYYPPLLPPLDPNVAAMLQHMAAMQQQIATLAQRSPAPATTGLSANPLPRGPAGLATLPVGAAPRGGYNARDENFDDNTARPIHQRVRRSKEGDIIDEDAPLPRRRNPNSLLEHDQDGAQTVHDYQRHQASHADNYDGVIMGFETLELSFVTGPIANRASCRVFFEIPGAGKLAAMYHSVVESKNCITLTYDSRYTEGMQYLPPELDDTTPIKLSVPHLKKTFTVASMGLTVPFGVFDHIILVKIQDAEPLDYDERRA